MTARSRCRRGSVLAADKSTAAALSSWIVFEDECGQSLEATQVGDLGAAGITPVIRVSGSGTGSVWWPGWPATGPATKGPG